MDAVHDLGKKGEDLAAAYLQEKGYRIIRRNWRSGKNEVDIIAEDGDFIVFAEVKTRSADFLIDPAAAVTREKQRSLIHLAENYIKWYNVSRECRFDIIRVIQKNDKFEIDHIEDAFYPTLR
ncbi:MAG TPA: YraN family protein [Bacteroidales bacterium]|nr:YraN family protein [Bacteroidales bacterium]HPI68819.1 YraN family protein [Bacteroidales bacterium]HPR73565.1 YraN family protein [Bacteroidales bacterium]